MTNNLTVKDLERIGFEKIGKWKALENPKNQTKEVYEDSNPIDHEWEDENYIKSLPKKILYAFVYGEEIKYIGKTTKGVKGRLKWYIDPSIEGHSTNKRVKKEIYDKLVIEFSGSNKHMDIWVFAPDPDTLKYKGFDLDLAAGLEEGLIAKIGTKCWNKIFKSK